MSDQTIPAGFYKAKAVAGSEQYGKTANGFDQIAFDLVLTDSEHAGFRATTFLVFSDASSSYSLDRLKACGWNGGNDLGGIDRNEVTVQVKYEIYQGKQQMKVDIATNGGRVALKDPMNDAEKRGFFTKLNEMAKSSASGQQQTQQRPADASGTNFPHGANAPPPTQNYKL